MTQTSRPTRLADHPHIKQNSAFVRLVMDHRGVSSGEGDKVQWPVTFTVGLTTQQLWRGGGELSVAPDWLVCTPGGVTAHLSVAQPVRHAGTRVDVFIARLVPPWFNVSVPVRGEAGTLVASMWIIGRRKLRRTLQQAGYDVVEHVTWVDRGFHWSEMKSGTPRSHPRDARTPGPASHLVPLTLPTCPKARQRGSRASIAALNAAAGRDTVWCPVDARWRQQTVNTHLLALRAIGDGRCIAEFERDGSAKLLSAEFWVNETHDIPLVCTDSDIFRGFDGSADEARQLNAAVLAFCRVMPS